MTPMIAIFLIGLLVLVWADFLRARERAVRVAEAACQRQAATLLDETVELKGLGLRRDGRGRLRLRRSYGFELTRDGLSRERGWLSLYAGRPESVGFETTEGQTIIESPERSEG